MFIQKFIDKVYRHPLANWKYKQRFGGYFSYRKMLKNQKEMIDASKYLAPIISNGNGLKIYFLTGKKYLYQTLFCAYSLNRFSKEKFQYILVDDGSFDKELINQVNKQMPNVTLILKEEIEKNLQQKLSINQYPHLNYRRKIYPHLKKLTDVHTIDDDSFKLVVDSDMLFWNNPTEIINWLKHPNGSIYMIDCEESYGYDKQLMQALCTSKIPDFVNVGSFGIHSNTINWNEVEHWAKSLEQQQGASYFLEQALSAMIIAKQHKIILTKDKYIVNPIEKININDSEIVLHHYVDLSKKYYFEEAWKLIINE